MSHEPSKPIAWDLSHKRALVCGASRGIGAACAQLLAARGAEVYLLARNPEKLQTVHASLERSAGQKHQYIPADLHDLSALKQLLQDLPAIQILINNSGGPAPGPVLTAEPKAFSKALENHVLAAQILVQALVPGMSQSQYGRIVNIISTSVKAPIAGLGVSNTIRGAMASWAKTLASELAPQGITVNNILPGFTATERLEQIMANRATKQHKSPEQVATEMRAQVPLGRFAAPQEIAEAVAFLCSPAAAYITGINLPVDGGRLPNL